MYIKIVHEYYILHIFYVAAPHMLDFSLLLSLLLGMLDVSYKRITKVRFSHSVGLLT